MRGLGFTFVALLSCTAPALAQTGATLLLQPWEQYGPETSPTEARAQWQGEALLFDGTDIDQTDDSLSLSEFTSQGRIKLSDEPGAGPSVGYNLLYLNLDSDDAALPERLLDVSFAGAGGKKLSDQWELGAVAGVGYAGARPFSDGDAAYFMGDLILAYHVDPSSTLTFMLNYDGNRTLWPDVPLPAVSYTHRVSDQLMYVAGLPYSSVTWRPGAKWKLEARYSVPYTVNLLAEYEIARNLHAFGRFDNEYDAFWLEDQDHRRIFFQQRRIEAGLRYDASDQASVVLAAGYAFSQKFEVGWDALDTDTLRDVDAEPYLRLGLNVVF